MITVGVDEVNFSPSLVGDCVVCALAFRELPPKGLPLRDSKVSTLRERLQVFAWAQQGACYAIELATVAEIQARGPYQARNSAVASAMRRVMEMVGHPPSFIVDGRPFPLPPDLQALSTFAQDGDALVPEVMAASMVAKVYVDALFSGMASYWPDYGFQQDHGSPSKEHIAALRRLGPSPYHRRGNYAPKWWERILSGQPARRAQRSG